MEENYIELAQLTKGTYGAYFENNYATNGSPKGFELEEYFKNPQANVDSIVSLARYYYNKSGLIMRVVNIIRDFGGSDFVNYYPTNNKKAKKIIDAYNLRININEVLRNLVFELALTGNVTCYNREFNMIDIYPVDYIEVLPIKSNGNSIVAFKPDYSGFVSSDYGQDIVAALANAYPMEVLEGMKTGQMKIILDQSNAYFKKVNSSPYERYGVPFILPAFDDIAHKTLLKEAERSTALGIIDKILMIHVGDKDNKPSTAMINQYASKFNSMKGAVRATVPYYVNLSFVEPGSEIFGFSKYEEVDNDLLSTLGVSMSLIKGEGGGNYAEGMINFTGLVRTIENIRGCIPSIFNDIYKKELLRHGISSEHSPLFSFKEVIIDKAAKLELVQWLFQNAGLPYETVYDEVGMDYMSIKAKRSDENDEEIEDIFKLREQPFQGNASQQSDEGGAPKKKVSERKSQVNQSNNDQPRAGISNL